LVLKRRAQAFGCYPAGLLTWLLFGICAAAGGYQLVAAAAVLRQLTRKHVPAGGRLPAISVLKPVHWSDARSRDAIDSHRRIDYPRFELLFGAHAGGAPDWLPPECGVLHLHTRTAPNPKVASLMELEGRAAGEVWVVNDADISVTPDYLRVIVAPLDDPAVGLVTCLYRAVPTGAAAFFEAIGIATGFAPSTLVAPLAGIDEFGLGSTLCFRAADLRRAGGFQAIATYLADDYQLARRLTRGLGKRAVMSPMVVDTRIEYGGWRAMWRHQVRWARTIRVSRKEYLGLPVTHAGVWAAAAAAAGYPLVAGALIVVRLLAGFLGGAVLLRCRAAWALPLIPLWDLFAFAVWVAGISGDTIEWRGRRLRLAPDGRLSSEAGS
jgi:ceramide glucosyltransferase